MEPDVNNIISELLEQNKKLQLELAMLKALGAQQEQMNKQLEQSKNIPPEALEMLSKLDIR
jgi:regulator of replication initiation timing